MIEPGRLYLGRARAIRVTMAPGPLGREQPLRGGGRGFKAFTVNPFPQPIQNDALNSDRPQRFGLV